LKVTIIGAGAIGGLLGGAMAHAGHDVVLVDRWAEHVEAINRNGLFVDGIRGEMRFKVPAIGVTDLRGPLRAVVIATKSMDAQDAARAVIPMLGPDGFLVSLQNGLHELAFADMLEEAGMDGRRHVVGAIPNYGAGQIGPGHLEFVHEGPIQLGEMDGTDTARLRQLSEMFACLTPVQVSRNIWGQVWAKEVYNNQVVCSALASAPLSETLGNPRYARLAGALVREAIGIAARAGIVIEPFDFFDPSLYDPQTPQETERLVAHIGDTVWKLRKDQVGSKHVFRKRGSGTWWDIKIRNRPSEVRWRNGRLVEIGHATGADVRLTQALCEMIYGIEQGSREFGFGNLEELEAYTRSIGKALPWNDTQHTGGKRAGS
jgi:2-dehydropantoate 2-reductase